MARPGRHKARYERYRAAGTRIKNKILKLTRYLLKYPNDKQAEKRLKELT